MQGSKTVAMLGSALLLGGAAAYLAVDWVNAQVNAQVAGKSSAGINRIAIAASDLRAGKELTASDLKLVDWPADAVPAGAVVDATALMGRVLRSNLLKGEPVVESRLAAKGSRGGIASVIAPGKRAISITVNDSVGMSAYALEGSHVDIIVNSSDVGDGDRQKSISKIVLERVLVLRTAQAAQADGRISAVTLEVTPSEAETVDLARSVGTLSLAIRSDAEGQEVKTKGATKESLFGLAPRPPSPVVASVQQTNTPAPAQPVAAAPRPVVVREVMRPAEPAPAKVAANRTCVDALIGNERRSECF